MAYTLREAVEDFLEAQGNERVADLSDSMLALSLKSFADRGHVDEDEDEEKEYKFNADVFLDSNGKKCPYCGSARFETDDDDFNDAGELFVNFECRDCENIWTATYCLDSAREK